jgi:hypothetical protein
VTPPQLRDTLNNYFAVEQLVAKPADAHNGCLPRQAKQIVDNIRWHVSARIRLHGGQHHLFA